MFNWNLNNFELGFGHSIGIWTLFNWDLDMFNWDLDDVESGFGHCSIGIWTSLNWDVDVVPLLVA